MTRGLLPVLEKALDGLAAGEKFNVTASPDEAFGHHDPEQVAELEREVFEIDGKFDEENIKAGRRLPMMTADGYRIDGLVAEADAASRRTVPSSSTASSAVIVAVCRAALKRLPVCGSRGAPSRVRLRGVGGIASCILRPSRQASGSIVRAAE